MATRTQLRLGQITGSFADTNGGIIDSLGKNAGGGALNTIALVSGSLVSVLSEVVSSIKRINGGATFANQDAGVFNQNLTIAGTTPKLTIGDAGAEDTAIVFDGNEQDFYVGLDDTDNKLHIGLGSAVGTTPNISLNSADRNVIFAGDIDVLGGKVSLTNGATIDSETAGKLKLTEDEVECSSALSVLGNATITGNLDVNGTTTTIDSVNLTVSDSIIALGVSGSGAYSASGQRGILFPRGTAGSATNAFWYDGTQFNLAVSKTGPSSGSFASIDSYSDLHVGDVVVKQDAGTLKFGADGDVQLTHVHNTGLLVNSTMELTFNDAKVGIAKGGTDRLQLRSNNTTFLFANARAASSGQALVGDGSGNLSFADVGGTTSKGIYILTASHAIGANFKVSADNDQKTATSDSIAALASSDAQGKNLDVFVNGQLLLSGAEGSVQNGTVDYMIAGADQIAFAFALEEEDIVQVFKRG